jgi:hypothetical protein
LAGISYPATKEKLVALARDHGASQDVLDALDSAPRGEYEGPDRVSIAVAKP